MYPAGLRSSFRLWPMYFILVATLATPRPRFSLEKERLLPTTDGDQHVLTDPLARHLRDGGGRANGLVAFGDSYSAGIGTGTGVDDGDEEDDCRLGLHAYPALIYSDLSSAQVPAQISFQFLSCTGSTTGDVLSGSAGSQVDAYNSSLGLDFALLSIGGNDLGFFDVINACVFRFYSFYSGTCEQALQATDEQIASPDFDQRLELVIMEILDAAHWEKRPWFFITVTGYARFFNADTVECDDMSFGIWWHGPKMTQEVRRRMNEMVIAVNNKLERAIDAINAHFVRPRVLFVNYDHAFEGHRFCEAGVVEPAYDRTNTWFFLVGGVDNNPNWTDPTPAPNMTASLPLSGHRRGDMMDPSSPLLDPAACMSIADRSGDWGTLALCYMVKAKQKDPGLKFANDTVTTYNSMWYVPTYYGKTFHPRSLGHEAIRNAIYRAWSVLEL